MAETTTKYLTYEELDDAIKAGTAKIVCDRPKWRLIVHGGFKYSCVRSTVEVWARPVGRRPSDYRGTTIVWFVSRIEPDTGYVRNRPRPAMPLDQQRSLIPKAA